MFCKREFSAIIVRLNQFMLPREKILERCSSSVTKKDSLHCPFLLVGAGGFGPPKSLTTDLQSAPFGRSGTLPYGAGERSRTINLLITNQLLCH